MATRPYSTNPESLSEDTGFTVDSFTLAIDTLMICNRDSTDGEFRIRFKLPGQAAFDNKQYIFYGPIIANDTIHWDKGIPLSPGIKIFCYSSSGLISFNFFFTVLQ